MIVSRVEISEWLAINIIRDYLLGQPNSFLENWDKLHSEVLAKMWVDTKFYRIPATFDHASEALKVPKAVRISPILVRLELQRRGQTLPVCDKIWCPLTFWPKLYCRVCPISPKQIWAGLLCSPYLNYIFDGWCLWICLNVIYHKSWYINVNC